MGAAAAAESLQLCPTLCDPRDSSPSGSPVSGILQARTLEWVAISFSKLSSYVKFLPYINLTQSRLKNLSGKGEQDMSTDRLSFLFFSNVVLVSAIRVVSSAYLRFLIFLPAILIPACASSSPAFLMMYSAYKLNKQGDNIQP